MSQRLTEVAQSLSPEDVRGMFDSALQQILATTFQTAQADEGTLWIADSAEEYLHPIYNSGPQANQLVGVFKQPLKEGIISMVHASQQAFIENEVWKNSRHSKRVDTLLRKRTEAMLATPVQICRQGKGIISCVHLSQDGVAGESRKFGSEQLCLIQRAADVISRCFDHRLLGMVIGWTTE